MSRTSSRDQTRQRPLAEPRQAGTDSHATPPVPGRTFTSEELFAGATEIGIRHDGAHYRLKITRQGKLILNK